MIQETREELLAVVADLARLCPDVRFGQLVTNLAYMADGPSNSAAWDVEDDQLLAAARQLLESRQAAAAVGATKS